LGVHVVFMIGDQVDRLWGRDFYVRNGFFESAPKEVAMMLPAGWREK